MSAYEIPLTAEPQTFFIDLAGTTYKLTLKWCSPMGCWILDIANSDEIPLIMGIPVITGVDLLKQYAYVGIKGRLFAQSLGDLFSPPTFTNLGTGALLFFVTP